MQLSTKEKEKLALQQVEFDDFRRVADSLEAKAAADFALKHYTGDIIAFVEKFLPYSIKMLHKQQFKRYSLYAATLKRLLWNVLEHALKQWASLGERELNRQTFVEIIMTRDAAVKDRGFVRLGKFLEKAFDVVPKEEEDYYFSKWLFFQISILEMNQTSIEFVKGKYTDSLSQYLSLLERIDMFSSPSFGDL